MASGVYSFIDIAVLDDIRERFAAGDALVLLSTDLSEVLWANGPGAALIGYPDIEAAIGSEPNLGRPALRQISATSGFPAIGKDRAVAVRLVGRLTSRIVNFLASGVALPDGEAAVLLAVPDHDAVSRDDQERARRAIGGFTHEGHFAALVGGDGTVAAASEGFIELGIAQETLRELAASARSDRLVKKRVPATARSLPAGLARLSDDPPLHLLVVVDEGDGGAAGSHAAEAVDMFPPHAEQGGETASPAIPAEREPPGTADTTVDRWYFSPAEPPFGMRGSKVDTPDLARDTAPVADRTPVLDDVKADSDSGPGRRTAGLAAGPVKFVWRTGADSRFSAISEEFTAALGADPADIVGHTFREIAEALGMDPEGEIAGLLERRDTWSGRSVMWPAAGTGLRVPVDLAALPVYGRDRSFLGFRGFGVARTGEAVHDPEAAGPKPSAEDTTAAVPPTVSEAPAAPTGEELEAATDPFRGEVPALAIAPKPEERRLSDKIIRLAEHRPPQPESGLSASERNAFREIGDRLKKDHDTGTAAPDEKPAPEQDGTEPAAPRAANDPALPADAEASVEPPLSSNDAAATGPVVSSDPGGATDASAPTEPAHRDAMAEDAGRGAVEETPAVTDILPSALTPGRPGEGYPDFYAAILARLPAPVLIHSGDRLHYANRSFLGITGYQSLEAIEAAGGLGALFADAYTGTADTEGRKLCLKKASGETFPAEALLQSVPWKNGKALMLALQPSAPGDDAGSVPKAASADGTAAAVAADAPLPEKAAGAGQETDGRIAELTTIIDTATDGVVLIAPDGTIRSISRPAEALFGFDRAEVAGKPFVSLFAIESQRAARDYLQGLSDNGVASVLNDGREVIGRESQGRFIPLFMTIGRLPGDGGFCAVVRDITQWKRAEEELTQARAQAERASSQKTEFLARVSHEIRTPLNAIIGFSELMIDEKFGPVANDRYRDYLRDINRSGNHVLDLVNDLLDISKIEAGEQEMNYEAVSLNDTLAETVAMMQPQANRERVIIRSSFPSRLPEVVADLRSVRQIALNLLSNAVRYTQAGGQVIVSTSYEASGDIVMRVRDTGVGMSQAEIEQAMKPFKQVNTLKRPRGDGTGLGLPLTKAMVEANRAKFSISSTPGEGTLVEITFPSTRVLAD